MRANTSSRRGTHVFYYIKLEILLFSKKHEKQITIMETQTFEQEQKTITVHTFEPNEELFPFAIIEQTTTNEDEEKTTFEVALGNMKASNKVFESFEDCENYIYEKPWDLIIALHVHLNAMEKQYNDEQLKLKKDEAK